MRKRQSARTVKKTQRNPLSVETLEDRVMLSVASGSLFDPKAGPMADMDAGLINLYHEYRSFRAGGGQDAKFKSVQDLGLVISKSQVVVTVHGSGSLTDLTNEIHKVGGRVVIRSSKYHAIDALVPITELHALAVDTQINSVNSAFSAIKNQQGVSNNQADAVEQADQVRSKYGLDGTGVDVGVLSDSVDQLGNGIAGSIATGDLPADGVKVIADASQLDFLTGANPDTDEGRAMLELIHDIAPGASLSFATTGISQMQMADNIQKLHAAGANVLVDDVSFPDEPYFQPGVIDDAISNVTADGAVYLSSAGNNGDGGFEQAAHFVTQDHAKFIDFDPSTAVSTKMQISTQTGGDVFLEWDNPYNGVTGNVTSDLDFYAYNLNGRLVASGTTNNIRTGVPLEEIFLPAPGRYNIQIRLADQVPNEPLPTMYKFIFETDAGSIGALTTQFGGTTSVITGHNGGPDTISVGAVAFFSASPFATPNTDLANETYSSVGPVTQIFDADGNRLTTPVTLQKPEISGVDGVNTSFFVGVTPFVPTLPVEGDIPQDPDVLPNFFGTSAAAPDVAAVVALIKQADPSATRQQIVSALEFTATPLNGTTTGTWDPQGGFGLINANTAVSQFVGAPTVHFVPVSPNPTTSDISSIKIVFSQQISGFDVSDLTLSVDGGPNLLTGNNSPTTTDGGRTWIVPNLAILDDTPGTYTITLLDNNGITNAVGLALGNGTSESWTKVVPPGPPTAPSNLQIKVLSDTSIRLRWSDNSSDEAGFTIQRATDEAFTQGLKTITVDANATTFTNTGLKAGTQYFYRIRAFNSFSDISHYSNIVSGSTLQGGEVVLDNSSTNGVTITGDWTEATNGNAFGGTDLDDQNDDKGAKSVLYRPNLQASGDYYVYMRWTTATNRATNVPVKIVANGKTTIVTVNERNTGGNGWVLLGKFNFAQGSSGSVLISTTGTNGHVIADAVRFLPASGGVVTPPTD